MDKFNLCTSCECLGWPSILPSPQSSGTTQALCQSSQQLLSPSVIHWHSAFPCVAHHLADSSCSLLSPSAMDTESGPFHHHCYQRPCRCLNPCTTTMGILPTSSICSQWKVCNFVNVLRTCYTRSKKHWANIWKEWKHFLIGIWQSANWLQSEIIECPAFWNIESALVRPTYKSAWSVWISSKLIKSQERSTPTIGQRS